jgi:hypothetical protein
MKRELINFKVAGLVFILGFTQLLLMMCSSTVEAEININFIAVNASEDQAKEIEVKYYLPKELDPDEVLDTGQLKLDYDVDKGQYYVHQLMQFDKKETKTLKVKVRDVWRITEDEISVLKNQLTENLVLLEGSANHEFAVKARDKLNAQLDFILAQQDSYSDNIDRRIEEYRAYVNKLEEIRSAAYDLDFLEHESKALNEMENLKESVKFVVEVENPFNETKKMAHKHYLPQEVREEDIIDKKDFDVRFDEKKNQAFLSKEESFSPKEKKKYEIVIKDVWRYPIAKLDGLQKRADLAMGELKETSYAKSAEFLYAAIMKNLTEIRESASLTLPAEQHIGLFRLNEKRYEEAKTDCERLEKMMSIVRAKKLKELESGRVDNVLQRLKALKGLAALANAVFKRGISVTVTWRIIFGTIIFVALFTTLHFVIWARRSGTFGEELGVKRGEKITEVPNPGAK